MPINVEVLEEQKLLIVKLVGKLTLADLEQSLDRINVDGALSYRKLVDLSDGEVALDGDELMRLAARTRAYASTGPLGAIAIFAPRGRSSKAAEHFLYLTQDKRRARIFRSIREARRWLDAVAGEAE